MYKRFYVDGMNCPRVMPYTCGRRACPPGWSMKREQFLNPYLIHFVVKGSGTFYIRDKSYSVRAGDLFICRPNESARYVASKQDPYDYIWIGFDCSSQFQFLLEMDVINIPAAGHLFIQMANTESTPAKEWTICGLLYQVFALLAGVINTHAVGKDYVNQAIAYIETNIEKSPQVSELTNLLGLSRSHFCRLFKQQTGMSPQEYIVTFRLEKAAHLLSTTNLPQKEIAQAMGYPDVYAFSKMFKRKYGISPGLYRSNKHISLSGTGE